MQAADSYFVDFRDVWLAYNDELRAKNQFAVEAIDLQVRRGEFIAIVGPSGCGKSTFMKLTTGLKKPSMGRIHVDGQPVTQGQVLIAPGELFSLQGLHRRHLRLNLLDHGETGLAGAITMLGDALRLAPLE